MKKNKKINVTDKEYNNFNIYNYNKEGITKWIIR